MLIVMQKWVSPYKVLLRIGRDKGRECPPKNTAPKQHDSNYQAHDVVLRMAEGLK